MMGKKHAEYWRIVIDMIVNDVVKNDSEWLTDGEERMVFTDG